MNQVNDIYLFRVPLSQSQNTPRLPFLLFRSTSSPPLLAPSSFLLGQHGGRELGLLAVVGNGLIKRRFEPSVEDEGS